MNDPDLLERVVEMNEFMRRHASFHMLIPKSKPSLTDMNYQYRFIVEYTTRTFSFKP